MSLRLLSVLLSVPFLALPGCSPTPSAPDAGPDAGPSDAPALDASEPDAPSLDAGTDAAPGTDADSCLVFHAAGDRYPIDLCNFCECGADGVETCTERTCVESIGGCTYDGVDHGYGERFPSTDGCNECVCAASGLACTRRTTCPASDEGAILLESFDEPCGADPFFNPRVVLESMPAMEIDAPFLYDRARTSYPESLADTTVHLSITRENGFFAVCRLPSPDQPALDIEVTMEWITEDGAFDEGLHGYLRRNGFGFVDSWILLASAPLGGLSGSYTPNCALDPGGYTFDAQMEPDGHAYGSIGRVCETDLFFDVGTFDRPAP